MGRFAKTVPLYEKCGPLIQLYSFATSRDDSA